MTYNLYKIRNKINGRCYIGFTSRSIEKRFAEHCHAPSRHRFISSEIQRLGAENFSVNHLATFNNESIARYFEMFFILKDKTLYPKGYNIACDGDKARFLAVKLTRKQNELF